MKNRRGRPTGHKLSTASKNKIRKSRTGQQHTIETRIKISCSLSKHGRSIMVEFVPFAIIYISKAKGKRRNPSMVDVIRAFISSRYWADKPTEGQLTQYGVSMRKSLEQRGYISTAAVSVSDRRFRYITPTPSFPSKGHTRQLDIVMRVVISDIREFQRVKSIKKRTK